MRCVCLDVSGTMVGRRGKGRESERVRARGVFYKNNILKYNIYYLSTLYTYTHVL